MVEVLIEQLYLIRRLLSLVDIDLLPEVWRPCECLELFAYLRDPDLLKWREEGYHIIDYLRWHAHYVDDETPAQIH